MIAYALENNPNVTFLLVFHATKYSQSKQNSLPLKMTQNGGRLGTVSQSRTYWPAKFFFAPSSLLSRSASVVGRTKRELPVSMAAPMGSMSSKSSPKRTFSSKTSQ